MDVFEAIVTRRSVRHYTDRTVADEVVKELLIAGMYAPSAGNQQAWHFIAVTEREQLDGLAETLPFGKMLRQAPLAIVVCTDSRLHKHKDYWVQDCSAAAQNILLAAHARGLGGVWLGVYPRVSRIKGVRTLLDLPEPITPLCVLSLGYPVESPVRAVDRYQAERIHYNRW